MAGSINHDEAASREHSLHSLSPPGTLSRPLYASAASSTHSGRPVAEDEGAGCVATLDGFHLVPELSEISAKSALFLQSAGLDSTYPYQLQPNRLAQYHRTNPQSHQMLRPPLQLFCSPLSLGDRHDGTGRFGSFGAERMDSSVGESRPSRGPLADEFGGVQRTGKKGEAGQLNSAAGAREEEEAVRLGKSDSVGMFRLKLDSFDSKRPPLRRPLQKRSNNVAFSNRPKEEKKEVSMHGLY
ncbi:unnamed protein product [Protopolystoma xenopodis]|uniref:Uncharacterized protein n=1 Tax=Protopolystoma xenopodis TaxID=117903 RepID=A0A448WLJ3_9PLAT|nr:unnamed protein product [Protopolystoma xenopodis]